MNHRNEQTKKTSCFVYKVSYFIHFQIFSCMKTVQKIMITLCFILTGNTASAHPPKDISAVYNPANKEITIFAEHYSADPQTHYIEFISISDEKAVLATQSFANQTSNEGQACKIILTGKKTGDSVTIYSKCNKFGKKRKKIVL